MIFNIKRINSIVVAFVMSVMLTIGSILLSFYFARTLTLVNTQTIHNYKILSYINDFNSTIDNTVNQQYKYIYSNINTYIETYNTLKPQIFDDLNQLQLLTADNPELQVSIVDLRTEAQNKIDEINRSIELKKTQGIKIALQVSSSVKSKHTTEKIQSVVSQVNRDLSILNNDLKSTGDWSMLLAIIFQIFTILLVLFIIILTIYYVRRKRREKERLMTTFDSKIKTYLLDSGDVKADLIENEVVDNLVNNLKYAQRFVRHLENGQYDNEFTGISSKNLAYNQSTLAGGLLSFRDKLKKEEIEKIKTQKLENQLDWANNGFTKFNNLLQQSTYNINKLGHDLIKNLVAYLGATQGGIYILNDENKNDKYFSILASFAFDESKNAKERIKWGEGLIGACAIEGESIFVDDVPQNYIKISSGLGKSAPACLLVVPLKMHNSILGILEVASLTILEKYQIEFVEKLTDSISATISIAGINEKTTRLLAESQQQAQELESQEEELRQNLDSLSIKQEETARRETDLRGILTAIDNTLMKSECEIDGTLIVANDIYQQTMGYSLDEIQGKNIMKLVPSGELDQFHEIWNKVCNGGSHRGTIKRKIKSGEDIWLLTSYTPVFDIDGKVIKILYLANNITEQKVMEEEIREQAEKMQKQEIVMRQNMEELMITQEQATKNEVELRGMLTAIDNALIKAEFDFEGNCHAANEAFHQLFEYSKDELYSLHIENLIPAEEYENFKQIWKDVCSGNAYKEIVKRKTKSGKDIWLLNSYTPIRSEYGSILKVLYLANNISEQKSLEDAVKRQSEALLNQETELKGIINNLEKKYDELTNRTTNQQRKDADAKKQLKAEIDNMYKIWETHVERAAQQHARFRQEKLELSQKISTTVIEKVVLRTYENGDDEIDKLYTKWLNNI